MELPSNPTLEIVQDWPAIELVLQEEPQLFPLSRLHLTYLSYWPPEELENLVNSSILVKTQGLPLALMLSLSGSESDFRFIDRPAIIELNESLKSSKSFHEISEEAIGKFLRGRRKPSGLLELLHGTQSPGPLEKTILDLGATPTLAYNGHIPLDVSEDEILSGMRSSHRRHVRKSEAFLSRVEISYGSVSKPVFQGFRDLYLQEAQQSYSESQWVGMLNALIAKEAFLVSSYLGSELVGATFCWISPEIASYGTGVYSRSLYSQAPLSHFPMFRSISFAREIGAKKFLIGEVYTPGRDEKQKSIAYFKRGFSDFVGKSVIFRLEPQA